MLSRKKLDRDKVNDSLSRKKGEVVGLGKEGDLLELKAKVA